MSYAMRKDHIAARLLELNQRMLLLLVMRWGA
jgi:hypothetical protein